MPARGCGRIGVEVEERIRLVAAVSILKISVVRLGARVRLVLCLREKILKITAVGDVSGRYACVHHLGICGCRLEVGLAADRIVRIAWLCDIEVREDVASKPSNVGRSDRQPASELVLHREVEGLGVRSLDVAVDAADEGEVLIRRRDGERLGPCGDGSDRNIAVSGETRSCIYIRICEGILR